MSEDTELIRVGEHTNATRYSRILCELIEPDWTLMRLTPVEPMMSAVCSVTMAAAFALTFAYLLFFYQCQRHLRTMGILRSRRLLEAAYDQLERRVEDRTVDLMATNE